MTASKCTGPGWAAAAPPMLAELRTAGRTLPLPSAHPGQSALTPPLTGFPLRVSPARGLPDTASTAVGSSGPSPCFSEADFGVLSVSRGAAEVVGDTPAHPSARRPCCQHPPRPRRPPGDTMTPPGLLSGGFPPARPSGDMAVSGDTLRWSQSGGQGAYWRPVEGGWG